MKDLSIRKLPGVGRVNERLLEAFGVKVRAVLLQSRITLIGVINSDLRRYIQTSSRNMAHGQLLWKDVLVQSTSRYRFQRCTAVPT